LFRTIHRPDITSVSGTDHADAWLKANFKGQIRITKHIYREASQTEEAYTFVDFFVMRVF
jgi:hypothetical protein